MELFLSLSVFRNPSSDRKLCLHHAWLTQNQETAKVGMLIFRTGQRSYECKNILRVEIKKNKTQTNKTGCKLGHKTAQFASCTQLKLKTFLRILRVGDEEFVPRAAQASQEPTPPTQRWDGASGGSAVPRDNSQAPSRKVPPGPRHFT